VQWAPCTVTQYRRRARQTDRLVQPVMDPLDVHNQCGDQEDQYREEEQAKCDHSHFSGFDFPCMKHG
jgi:hypothetical protein